MKFSLNFLLLLVALTASGQKKPMTLIDFLNIPGISDPVLSPDGKQFVYVKSESDWKEGRQVGHLYRGGSDGEELKLTNGEKGETNPAWSPDGKWISFVAKRSGDDENQLYVISNAGGEGARVVKHKTAVRNIQWSDNQTLYFLSSDPKTKEEEKKEKLKDDVYAYDENFKQTHLWRVHLGDTAATRITSGNYSVNDYSITRTGEKIIITKGTSPLLNDGNKNELWLTDINGKNEVQVTTNSIAEIHAELSPDGKNILFVANSNANFESYYNSKLFIVPATGGKPTIVLKEFPYEVLNARWSRDGSVIYVLANKGLETQLFTFTMSNASLKEITRGDHELNSWNYQPEVDQHLVCIASEKSPGDVWLLKGEGKESTVQFTHVFDYLDRNFSIPKQERVTWKGADGVSVEGLLIYPANYTEGQQYPLVVQTHGGPASADHFGLSRSYTAYHPVLAAKGYIILLPNYRGSTGYGDAFLRDMVGSYFKNAHLDVMKGVDYLISRKLVDQNRMVKMGWSAGGHMTNKLITFTPRFKAASSGAGAANWISMYAQSDIRIYRTAWFGGTPWQKNAPIETFWSNSPLKDISKVTTPTLFVVGGNDVRVPLPQSVEMYNALKSLGVPTHLYVAPREPHGWAELRHRLNKMNLELEWFAKYALNEGYTWEKGPEK